MSVLKLENLTLRFGGLTAVADCSLDVQDGQIFAIIGPNGAGKTSAFNAVTGVYDPTEGRILLCGKAATRPFTWKTLTGLLFVAVFTGAGLMKLINIEALWEATIVSNYVYQQPFPWGKAIADSFSYFRDVDWRYSWGIFAAGGVLGFAGAFAVWQRARRSPDVIAQCGVARTFQNLRLFHQMTVLDNVLVGMDTKLRTRYWHAALRLPRHINEKAESRMKAMKILEFVELDHEASSVASSLSYGHQRRLEIARALASDPKLLLLDEPGAGMNPSEKRDLMELIRRIRDRGVTVLLIEHDMKVVMGLSDRIAVLDYGHKIAEGTPDEIRAHPEVRKAYLGTTEV